jgi:hypothetical protein
MNVENPQEAMTFGELLALIGDQQRRLTVLESAFSTLSSCLDPNSADLLIQNLRLEAQNLDRDENMQVHFTRLAEQLEKHRGIININPE